MERRYFLVFLCAIFLVEAQIFTMLMAMGQIENAINDLRIERDPVAKLMRSALNDMPTGNTTNSTGMVNLTKIPKFPEGVQP